MKAKMSVHERAIKPIGLVKSCTVMFENNVRDYFSRLSLGGCAHKTDKFKDFLALKQPISSLLNYLMNRDMLETLVSCGTFRCYALDVYKIADKRDPESGKNFIQEYCEGVTSGINKPLNYYVLMCVGFDERQLVLSDESWYAICTSFTSERKNFFHEIDGKGRSKTFTDTAILSVLDVLMRHDQHEEVHPLLVENKKKVMPIHLLFQAGSDVVVCKVLDVLRAQVGAEKLIDSLFSEQNSGRSTPIEHLLQYQSYAQLADLMRMTKNHGKNVLLDRLLELNNRDENLLHVVARNKHHAYAIMSRLKRLVPNFNDMLLQQSDQHDYVLHIAARYGSKQLVAFLFRQLGMNLPAVIDDDISQGEDCTLLIEYAIGSNSPDVVQEILCQVVEHKGQERVIEEYNAQKVSWIELAQSNKSHPEMLDVIKNINLFFESARFEKAAQEFVVDVGGTIYEESFGKVATLSGADLTDHQKLSSCQQDVQTDRRHVTQGENEGMQQPQQHQQDRFEYGQRHSVFACEKNPQKSSACDRPPNPGYVGRAPTDV